MTENDRCMIVMKHGGIIMSEKKSEGWVILLFTVSICLVICSLLIHHETIEADKVLQIKKNTDFYAIRNFIWILGGLIILIGAIVATKSRWSGYIIMGVGGIWFNLPGIGTAVYILSFKGWSYAAANNLDVLIIVSGLIILLFMAYFILAGVVAGVQDEASAVRIVSPDLLPKDIGGDVD